MSEKVYKTIRVVGCSSESYQKAVETAVSEASKTLHGLAWFEVVEMRGAIGNGTITDWQVTLDVSFKIEKE
jgi:dodecin